MIPPESSNSTQQTTSLPSTVPELRELIRKCEQRIHEIEWDRLKGEPCLCDRYTCSNCQERALHRPFIKDATNAG